jgi:hypothetical protein
VWLQAWRLVVLNLAVAMDRQGGEDGQDGGAPQEVWVPITLSQLLTWCLPVDREGGVRDPAARRRPVRHL